MTIFQPDRFLLYRFAATHAAKCHGILLDIGCGGKRYRHLFTHCTYTTLDVRAEEKPDIVASAEEIPLPDASIDAVLCTQVLGDIWALEKTMSEIARILRKGGLLILTESFHGDLHDEPHDYWRFTPYTMKQLLRNAFTIEILEPRGGYFTMRAQAHIRRWIEKYDLYHRPLLGRIVAPYALIRGKWSILRDRWDDEHMRRKFAIGYNVLARKK